MRTHTDFDGQTTAYAYDGTPAYGGRLLHEYRYDSSHTPTFAGDGTLQNPNDAAERTDYTYDDLGRQESVTDYTNTPGTSNWSASTYTDTTYDPVTGNPDSITTPEGVVHYVYDSVTGQHTETYTDHNDTSYVYDDLGELWKVHVTKLNDQTVDQWIVYGHDVNGDLTSVSDPNGITTTYTYDDLSRLTDVAVENTSTSEPVFVQHYELNDDGTRKDVVETQYNADGTIFSEDRVDWTYDGDGRLVEENMSQPNGSYPAPGVYDNIFAFDLNGNRIEEDINGGDGQTGGATVLYTYNSDDQLLTETRTGTGAYEIVYGHDDGGTFVKGYDANGSLVEEHKTVDTTTTDSTYAWDLRNRMVSATIDGSTTSYTYSTDGIRTSETSSGNTTYYVNDPANPTGYTKAIEEKSSPTGSAVRSYVLGMKVEAQSDTTNGTLYLLSDGHGSTRALADSSGVVQEHDDYDAWGNRLESGTSKTRWLQPDGSYDESTGLTNQLGRLFDRRTGRAISFDSFEADPASPADLNKYVLDQSNPLCYIDINGHEATLAEVGTVAGESATLMSIVLPSVTAVEGAAAETAGLTTLLGHTIALLAGTTIAGGTALYSRVLLV